MPPNVMFDVSICHMARHPINMIFSWSRDVDDTLKQLSVGFREVIPHCVRERRFQVLQFLPEGLAQHRTLIIVQIPRVKFFIVFDCLSRLFWVF